jgi:hypothetical protein
MNFVVAVENECSLKTQPLNHILSHFNSAHISITYLLKTGLFTGTARGQPFGFVRLAGVSIHFPKLCVNTFLLFEKGRRILQKIILTTRGQ